MLFVLWTLLAIMQPAYAGDASGCPLAANVSSLVNLIPASTLPCPDGLELKYLLLGIGTQNYTCLSEDEGATPENAGAIGEWICIHFSRDCWKAPSKTEARVTTTSDGSGQGFARLEQSLHAWFDEIPPFLITGQQKTRTKSFTLKVQSI